MKFKSFFAFLVIQLGALALIQGLFHKLQTTHAQSIAMAVSNLLREEQNQGNPQLISRTIEDMENAGILKCSTLSQKAPQPQEQLNLGFRNKCTKLNLLLDGGYQTLALKSLNGAEWTMTFIAQNGPGFYWSLWITRILMSAAVSLAFFIYHQERKKRDELLEIERKFWSTLRQVSTQVAHDIRSPLAALSMAERDLAALPEDTRLIIRSAIGRIQDIASQLMLKANAGQTSSGTATPGRDEAQAPSEPTLLSAVIETILAEKRMQYRARLGIKIESAPSPEAQALFAAVQPREFKRVISNLINNAVEATPDAGHVTLSLEPSRDQKSVTLRIRDTGKGIPGDIVEKLGARGFSHEKEGGSGLGLYHARTSLESWGGSFALQSEPGTGTEVALTLPLCEPPAWFQNSLELESGTQVVVLDDDQSIHQVWQGRMESAQAERKDVTLAHFSTPQQLREWYQSRSATERARPTRYLIDYEILGARETGLDLIESLGIAAQSVLVTSRYEEPGVRARCEAIGLKLLPKALAGFVMISIKGREATVATRLDAVLVDDDALVHTTWNLVARQRKKTLKTYLGPDALLKELATIPKDTPIYIDSNLGPGIKGEVLLKDLSARGYTSLWLATGYEPDGFVASLAGTSGFRGVQDKSPPWV